MSMRRFLQAGALWAWPLGNQPLQEARDRYVVTGAPGVVQSPWGMSLSMDGLADYFTLTSAEEFWLRFDSGSQDFSIVSWLYTTKEAFEEIIDKRDALNDGWELAVQADGNPLFRLNALACTGPSANIFDDLWHCVIATVDRDGNMYMYVDGVAGTAQAVGGAVMATTVSPRVGCCSYVALTNLFEGAIAKIGIIDRILSADEALDLSTGAGF